MHVHILQLSVATKTITSELDKKSVSVPDHTGRHRHCSLWLDLQPAPPPLLAHAYFLTDQPTSQTLPHWPKQGPPPLLPSHTLTIICRIPRTATSSLRLPARVVHETQAA